MSAKAERTDRRPRLDQALVEQGLAESRAKAQELIAAGVVYAGGQRLDKPSRRIAPEVVIELRGEAHPWVSRGGLKLSHALDTFAIDPSGKVALDVGASTGGFTDVLLARGARRVHAVDVGHGQLAERLRADPRLVDLERVNARTLDRAKVPEAPDIVVCDVSFIGLERALPAALALARPGAVLIALIKPQFEVGKGRLGKGGIVRDPGLHAEVVERIRAWLSETMGWRVIGVTESPVTGAEGNREFLIAAEKRDAAGAGDG